MEYESKVRYRSSGGVVKIWFSEMENDDNEDNPGVSSAPEGGTTTEEKTDETTTEENAARREIISNCGNIDVGLEYNLINKRITVTILECSDLPNQDRGVPPIIQVKLYTGVVLVWYLCLASSFLNYSS